MRILFKAFASTSPHWAEKKEHLQLDITFAIKTSSWVKLKELGGNKMSVLIVVK